MRLWKMLIIAKKKKVLLCQLFALMTDNTVTILNTKSSMACIPAVPGDHGQQRPRHGFRLADGWARQPEGQSAHHLPWAA